jgi:hypothetical protein
MLILEKSVGMNQQNDEQDAAERQTAGWKNPNDRRGKSQWRSD